MSEIFLTLSTIGKNISIYMQTATLRENVIQTTDSLIFQSFQMKFVPLLKLSFSILNFLLKQHAMFTAYGTHLFLFCFFHKL